MLSLRPSLDGRKDVVDGRKDVGSFTPELRQLSRRRMCSHLSTVYKLTNRSRVQRMHSASKSMCTWHVERGKTSSMCNSARLPMAIGSTSEAIPAGGVRPRPVRNRRTAAASRGVRTGLLRRRAHMIR
eukprot:1520413-Prymnesium_polylepis.1